MFSLYWWLMQVYGVVDLDWLTDLPHISETKVNVKCTECKPSGVVAVL